MSMPSLLKNYILYLTDSWEDKEVHTIPKGIRLKTNLIALVKFELSYIEVIVRHFSYKTLKTPHYSIS